MHPWQVPSKAEDEGYETGYRCNWIEEVYKYVIEMNNMERIRSTTGSIDSRTSLRFELKLTSLIALLQAKRSLPTMEQWALGRNQQLTYKDACIHRDNNLLHQNQDNH